jgi:hypothetical protein
VRAPTCLAPMHSVSYDITQYNLQVSTKKSCIVLEAPRLKVRPKRAAKHIKNL